jgi:hypothetical protein
MQIDTVARAVAAHLSAEVDYWPEFDRAEIVARRVIVVPSGIEYTRESRGDIVAAYTLDIGVLQRVANEDELPTLVADMQTLGRSLLGEVFAGCRVTAAEYDPLYAPEKLREQRQFLGVVKLTLRGLA